MSDNKYIRALSSAEYPTSEGDDVDTQFPVLNPEQEADCIDIVDKIGTTEFLPLYTSCNYFFKQLPIDTQIDFCGDIITRISDVYAYDIPTKAYFSSVEDINSVYGLLEFIEFDNVEFTKELFQGLIEDARSIDARAFVASNWKLLNLKSIKNVIKLNNPMIIDFISSNTKDNLINFFTRLIINNMLEITISNIETL
jgi:hypothetical protein